MKTIVLSCNYMNKNIHNSKGVAMVEFAFVAPLLVMLVFGITELGRAMYQLNMISKAASTGARYLSRLNGVVEIIYDGDTDKVVSCSAGPQWGAATDAVKNLIIYGSESGSGVPILPEISVEFDPLPHVPEEISQGGNTTTGCVITVKVSGKFVSVFGGETMIPFTTIEPPTLTEVVQERFIGE